jgi:predicted RNA-binding protein
MSCTFSPRNNLPQKYTLPRGISGVKNDPNVEIFRNLHQRAILKKKILERNTGKKFKIVKIEDCESVVYSFEEV